MNASIFFNDHTSLQILAFLQPGVVTITNPPAATIKGLEIEAVIGLGTPLQLQSTAAWLDARYGRYQVLDAELVTRDVAGKRLNNAPQWSGATAVLCMLRPHRGRTLSLRGGVTWQSRVFFTPVNDDIETRSRYGQLHGRAAYGPLNQRWELAAYVRNATGTSYITGTVSVPRTAFVARPGEPRNWGTELTIRY